VIFGVAPVGLWCLSALRAVAARYIVTAELSKRAFDRQ
jgi:hypothetical protein